MTDFLNFIRNQYTALPFPQAPSNISDATYLVTGANSGLGYECAKHLFRLGAGRIILAVRSREKGEAALAAICQDTGATPGSKISIGEVWELDLTSFDSVEAFSRRLGTLNRLDALIANAGVAMTRFQAIEGMELSLFVNVVATMLLGLRALPKLRESASRFGIRPHLLIVTSAAAIESKMKGTVEKLQGNVFDALSTKKGFNTLVTYPTTKLLEVYAVRELASLLPVSETGVIINHANPGLCYSELDQNAPAIPKLAMAAMRKMFARTAEEGSRNILQGAFAGPESHGVYCSECQVKDHVLPTWITDEAGKLTQKRVWDDLLEKLDSKGHNVDIAALVDM